MVNLQRIRSFYLVFLIIFIGRSLPAAEKENVNDENILPALLQKAEQGDPNAQFQVGIYEAKKKNVKKSLEWLNKAAIGGNTDAEYALGTHYFYTDPNTALQWYRKAAEHGNKEAQNWLGLIYSGGIIVEQNDKESIKWYRMAAIQGDEAAQKSLRSRYYHLGFVYITGQGVEKDVKEAIKWFQKAAEMGSGVAQLILAQCYSNGEGVIEDYTEAYKWALLAGMNGEDVSKEKSWLAQRMTATQVAEGQRRAKEFVAKVEMVDEFDDHILKKPELTTSKSAFEKNFVKIGGFLLFLLIGSLATKWGKKEKQKSKSDLLIGKKNSNSENNESPAS